MKMNLSVLSYCLIAVVCSLSEAAVIVDMVDSSITVKEGAQFSIKIRKTGIPAADVFVVVELTGPQNTSDFVSNSQPHVFKKGDTTTEVSLTLTTTDDTVPEKAETFLFQLRVTLGPAIVGNVPTVPVTIQANDDAFGVFGFDVVSPVVVTEPQNMNQAPVSLAIKRSGGQFGKVILNFQVTRISGDTGPVTDDIAPVSGTIIFTELEKQKSLDLNIQPDLIPEGNETYSVNLSLATQGARIDKPSAEIIILFNDAPIHLGKDVYIVNEAQTGTVPVNVLVYRGLAADTITPIGPAKDVATVNYFVLSGSAVYGQDFVASNGTVRFDPGIREQVIQVYIQPDAIPENTEKFSVVLANTIGDVVLVSPNETTIMINPNDDHNGVIMLKSSQRAPPVVRVNEDITSVVRPFTVERKGGVFGNVTVKWQLTAASTVSITDFTPLNGVVTFLQGEREKVITLNVMQDVLPEAAELFTFSLLNMSVTGGARVEHPFHGSLIIEDSDAMYGVIEFGPNNQQKLSTQSKLRKIEVSFQRTGGLNGEVEANISVSYTSTSANKISIQDILLNGYNDTIVFANGISQRTVVMQIKSSAFLSLNSYFTMKILSVRLLTSVSLGPYNSPMVGSVSSVTINVTAADANGEIGFESTKDIVVDEPTTGPLSLKLKIVRAGTNGDSIVYWTMVPTGSNSQYVTAQDTGATSGSVTLISSNHEAFIDVAIMPDNVPETNEEIYITLTSAEPSAVQKLRVGATQVKIIIRENDNPGGIFQFSPAMQNTYSVQEGQTPIFISVVRTGGSLVTRSVLYGMTPDGSKDFYGAKDVLVFKPGETEKNGTILSVEDQIPELAENFSLILQPYGSTPGTVGARNKINITIQPSNDPNGILEFDPQVTSISIAESKGQQIAVAEVPVVRGGGTFGQVTAQWALSNQNTNDLTPVTGSALFQDKQKTALITIQSVPDQIPEPDKVHVLTLTAATGGAKVGVRKTIQIIIRQNDDAISFKEPFNIDTAEPSIASLTIMRKGNASTTASVSYQTVDGSANSTTLDYTPIVKSTVTFAAGETEKVINVTILDDGLPEARESFYVDLSEPTGDVVLFGVRRATVTILPNDVSAGIFKFAPPLSVTTQEGKPATFNILREGGKFGAVAIAYSICDNNSIPLKPDNVDFVSVSGSVTFLQGEDLKTLNLIPAADGIPEFQENFRIKLDNITVVNETDQTLAVLNTKDLIAEIIVTQNDDPNGVIGFQTQSRELSIAEDYYPGEQTSSVANFTVERAMGLYGSVQAVWMIFSDKGSNLPNIYDLLFLCSPAPALQPTPAKARPSTGTVVLDFNGSQGAFCTLAAEAQPPSTDVINGFSISVWIQPTLTTKGYVVAKVDANDRLYFGIKVMTTATQLIVTYMYSVSGNQNIQTTALTATESIVDGAWHNIILTVGGGVGTMYLDGRKISSSNLGVFTVQYGSGKFYVGASSPNDTEKFVGLMQDLLFFSRKLEAGEIAEVYSMPSRKDLVATSGYVTFDKQVSKRYISTSSVQDTEEENDEVFSVRLISAKGGARISKVNYAGILKILKSDNANGLFGFNGLCSPAVSTTEADTLMCTVVRTRGNHDTVTVTWMITLSNQIDVAAETDFVNNTGTITFLPGERQKTFDIKVFNDNIPEVVEKFDVVLKSALSADQKIGSTNTSGASIDPAKQITQITIAENDFPYGLLQFSENTTAPVPGSVIQPIDKQPQIRVAEETGFVKLMIVRSQGLRNIVTIEWRTVDGTAKSSGNNPDFKSAGSRLTFDPNEQYKFIQVKIVDDSIPEDDKFFEVELRNPTGGAAIDVGSKIRVVVENSDNAYGVFQFDNATTANTIIFEPPHGITSAKYAIRRTEGRIGSSEVTWSLSYSGNKDFVADQGIVGFIAGQEIAYFDVTALADSIPEKKEVFTLSLANITKGILGDNRQTSVSIAANDDPYGVFTISSTSKIISTTEGNKDVSVIIFRSRGSFGSVTVNYATAADNESFSFINPNIPRARATIDYTPVQSSVTFSVGQTEASFKIGIKDDYDSESDEAIYVVLKSVILNPIPPMDQVANSPKLGATMNTYSQIIVKGNDNGTSIILLSATDVTVFENQTGSVISIIRKGGMYGQVTVKFSVTPGLARYGEDYTVSSTDIVFANQETMKQLPIKIIDDPYPELAETFTVQLLEPLIGNAIMGSPIKATVTIEASDDPLGTFDFAKRSVIVDEPSTGQKTNVDIQVVRTGGNLGVPAVSWQTTYDGVPPTTDIKPTSGVLHFVSNETSLPVKIEVLPDTKPEGNQNINVTLVSVTNGGHIGPNNNFILTIRANDNPHGTVEFIGDTFTVYESANSTTQYVTANRIGGTVSDVRVYYSLQEIDPLSLLAKSGRTMLSYFAGPIERNATSTGQKIDIVTDPLNSCGSACLASKSCMTFELTVSTNSCHLYNKLDMATITSGTGTQYYTKKTLEANSLYMEQAQAGVDYAPVSNGQAIMKDGEDVVGLPISILQDNIPELNEQLIIKLEKVELVNDTQGSKELPKLGNKTLASVVIATNDNAYGLFRIFSNDPRASQNGSQVAVDEQDNLAVELQVERTGGSLGDVSVDWFIDTATSTAIAGNDYEAGGGITLLFAHGQIRKTITVAIRDDTLPENDESVIVKLGKPTGGASIGSQGVVDVIIKANDDVAGRIGFQQKSIVVHEGEKVNLVVERSSPALGNVSVYWMIERVKGLPPHQSFRQSTGYLLFIQGQLKADLQLEVLKDNLPEVHEEYNIRLWNLSVSGIRSEGVASLDPQRYNLGLSIRGSDDPHGIIGFALSSQKVTTVEANKTLDLTIERKFGTIGAVLVNFTVKQGNVTALNSEQELATAGKDFLDYGSGVVIRDGSTSATMKVYILDDSIPEVDEVFIVQLLNVSLIQPKISPLQPALASSGTTAEILIKANDGTKGVVFFSAESAKKSVNETAGEVVLSVIRSMGTFGNVSVYCYAQPGSATIGVDFIFDPQDIVFAPGQSKRDITVQIVNDGKAEPPETFELVLASPKNGVQLGVPNKAEVTIGPSDDASGFVSFSISDVIYLNEPSATSSVNSQVEIPILRGPGLYGKILVPFKITRVGNTKENVTDVTPTSGFITILDSQTSGSLMIQALADNIAELDEAFVIELSKPQGGAQLGKIIRRSLIIRQNDSPYGLMQIYPKSSSANTIDVEEDVGRVEYRIVRQGGTRGTISVNVFIEASSAQAPSGTTVFLSKYQKLPAKYPVGWSSLKIGSTTYGVLLNRYSIGSMNTLIGSNGAVTGAKTVNNSNIDQYSMVYRWQGVYRPVQTLETNGASFATSFNIGGKSYFLVINSGAIGNYETKSRLYEINEAGVVKVIQDFYTRNGQKATVFTQGLDQFAVIVNYQDNSGETNINSELYKWEQNAGSFSSMAAQYISTIGARDVTSFKINQQLYLCIANNYDSKTRSYEIDSILYKFNSSAGLFAITQRFQTKGATALSSFSWGNDRYLIIANSRDNFGDTKQDVIVYKWNFVLNAFVTLQNIPSISTSSLDIFQMDGIVFLTVASSSASAIHEWNPANLQFQPVWNGSSATSIYPNIIPQTNGFLTTMMISSKDLKRTDVYIFSRLSKSADFVPINVLMTFQSGESELTTAVAIMNDTLPEDTETFIIRLQNPTGGAELGAQSSVITRILVNDNAFGIVEFAPDSLEVRESESVGKDKVFAIRLRRTGGVAGSVIVKWEFDNSNAPTDIQPTFGKVEFAPGSPFASIPLTIKDDNIAEMDKAYKIYLRSIVNSGTDLPGRGAKIGANNVSTLIIQASDNKYGVFSWELTAIETQEPTAADGIVKLFVIREQGVQGNVVLEYMTTPDGSKPADRQAISGADYTSKQGTVTIAENTRKAAVDIFIKSDDVPERSESFLVKMNTVRLLGGNTPAVGPSIKKPGDIATVTIMENDDAAGIIQFDIAENKNQVDTYEGIGILRLNVARTVGTYGNVTVSWRTQALDIPAAMVGRDFIPGSGNITFIEGQKSATIDIQIIDDSEIEGLEMFEVILDKLSNPSARIGTSSRLKIGIVKNDSPNGEFGFVESQKIVREGGIIRLTVERTKSLQGRVNLRWSLNVNAKPEFMPPANGEITFNNGERLKSFDLQAKVDSTLEGAENYTVSLVSNDNNGDISPTKYQCVITIQADDGAAGKAHIVPSYRQIFMGEPSASYNGKGKIRLTRGIGKFGTVTINWQITPRNTGAFVVEYGTVTFLNLQAEVDIVLQSRDDTIPEGKRDYVLEISGGSGEVSSDVTKIRSIITMVASDFPHGLFQFLAPSVTTASEDSQKIQVIVNRDGGNQGQVRVGYATVAGTAKDAIDYASATGTIEFLNGETQKTISVTILQDTLPEGPEYFFINLTSVALTSKVNNNYTKVVGDLGLDMPPILGPGRQKKVIIEKNDNAEGTVQFAANAINFLAKEDEGMARIPLVRTGGSYGTVGVRYRSNNRTATSTLDYKLPDGSIEFADGVTENTINVTIVNDLEREFGEEFEVILISIYGGAQLGDRTMSLVTIAKSDYPNGKFGFVNDVKIAMTNPDIQKTLTLTVERTEGTLGEQTVFWRIMGYNDPNSQLFETNDVSTMINNKEETTGQLAWTAGELGQKIITLQIKPHVQWEIQKIFWIELYRISGVPATSGSGEVSPTNGKTELTILKFGDPNGIIGFDVQSRQVRTFSEPASSQPSQIDFQLFRSKGLIGAQQIYWEINSPPGSSNKDVSPTSGFVTIGDKKSVGNIKVLIEPDDIPELDEAFSLKLLKIVGGAEIDPQFNSSQFIIQFNDYPHGTVGVLSKNQAVIVRNDKTRAVRVNVTRNAGRVGRIRATFIVKYQQDSTYTATGEAIFEDGDRFKTAVVDAPRNVFIPLGSQFAITLTDVTYIGGRGPVTQAPIIVANQQTCTVAVPQAAANSKVGFAQQEVNIDEASNTASVSVIREGSYGSLEVSWAHGFPPNQLPSGFQMGLIITAPGIISFSDGESEKKISIKVRPNVSRKELFAIYMPIQPSKTPDGGAMLYVGKTVTRMESMGVIRFAANSLKPRIQENIGDLQLNVERLYGSEGTIQVLYSTLPGTAKGGVDYVHVTNAAVKLDPGVTQTTIKIQMKSDSLPEEVEYFFVNLTTVYQLPNSNPTGITPRISKLNALSNISVAMNSDPYGLLYMEKNQLQVSEGETINLTPHVKRGGGTKGDISVMIRTALKGEIVPNYPALQPSADGTDVMKLNQNIFIKGGTVAPIDPIRLQIVKDALIEGNEIFYVYLTQPTGGAVISAGSNTYKSYVEVMIKRNGLWGGEVGFYQTSSGLTIDEDGKGNVTVTLIRNATFGDITVAWQLREKTANGYKFNTEGLLKGQFKMLRSDVTCPQGQTLCRFTIETINDEIPEHQSDFEVFLESVIPQNAASINPNANSIRITMLPSDYPDGLLQFSLKTRRQFVNMDAKVVYLMIERLKGAKGNITVKYETRQLLSTSVKVAGITIHEAVSGRDFRAASGIINFKPQQTSATISIVLTPFSAGVDTLYPKMFHIALFEATSGASVHTEYGVANVTLVTTGEEEVWTLYGRLSEIKNLDDSAIESLLPGLTNSVAKKLTEKNLMLIEDILGKIAAEGEKRVLPHSMRASMMSIFCSLMSDRNDATRGRYQLVQLFEKWTFTYLTGKPCETAKPIEIVDCGRVKATLALWYPENINGFKYNAMYKANFQLPNNLLSTTNSGVKKCEAVQFIDYYKTEQWFMQGNQKTLLSNRVISFNIKGKASHVISSPITYRIYTTGLTLAPKRSLCVYSGTIANQWEVKTDICKVTNNLDLALDNFVDCSCQHLSNYAVQTLNPGLDVIGYPLWFKISAFICMACMILAVLAHHICSVYSMFSANLLMHMVFAIFATEVCYVINAYVSPFDILITEKGMDNYKCIVMGLFSHYFFLAQFTWLFAQALNFWKILVLNDEHTDRKYILYILIGWGLPIIIIAIFYAISFSVYRYVYSVPVTDIHIYGNVNNNGVICFITSPYAALGGLIIPCIICVMVLGVVFIQAYQVAPQWQAYDDIYRGRYNINEVRTLLLFWTLLVLTWLWGGLHLAYSQLWMLILFCIFNILLGLYALVIYTFLRNPCLPCVRPKNSSYTFPVGLNQDQHVTHYNDQSPSIADSLKGSKLSLVHDWDQDSLTQVGHMQVKRAPAIDDNIFSIYDNKVALDDERDDKDFDDLIFALKTGTLTPSELSHNIDKDYDGLHSPSATLTRDPYLGEMRRISIADTHL